LVLGCYGALCAERSTWHVAPSTMNVSDCSEQELIARVRARLLPAPDWLTVGIGDDAAVVEPERNRLEVLTVDAIVEGIHFDRQFTPPDAIGHRALAVNLSDLAAMGAEPRLALLSFCLPADLRLDDFDAMVGGLAALANRHRLHVIGGNLTRSPGPLMLDVTVVGTVKRRQALTRAGARPGDVVFVTGSIGGAAAGLEMLRRQPGGDGDDTEAGVGCIKRYLYPEPRVRTGLMLARNRAASACMDLSDGLADGIRQIAQSSGVGMIVDADALPIDAGARAWFGADAATGGDAVARAMTGGDDYELVFTVRPKGRGHLRAAGRHVDVPRTRIGVCTEAPDIILRRSGSDSPHDEPIPRGYKHFG
jgi:thiamine-monophosphate kinase